MLSASPKDKDTAQFPTAVILARPESPSLAWRHYRAFKNLALTAVVLTLMLAPPPTWAWGREGHRLTALVAEHYLTPEARIQIAELLHNESLADISSWADDFRTDHRETAPWHFVDIPTTAQTYDRDRDCPVAPDKSSPWRDCVVDRILYFEGQLGDASLNPKQRAIALKFLVHFIGDIHQPLHALGFARGSNDVRVTFLGSSECGQRPCNLHTVWDESLIEAQNLNEKKLLALLLQQIDDRHWDKLPTGDPAAWAAASHHYALLAEVPSGTMLTRDYVDEESKLVDAQLAFGGLRLASVLNRILVAPGRDPR